MDRGHLINQRMSGKTFLCSTLLFSFFNFQFFFFFCLFLSYEAVKVSSRGMIFSFKVGREGGRVIQAASLERIIWAN